MATGYSFDDDFQKRAKYLVHLPYSCEIVFLEWDCTDIVSTEFPETFRVEIDQWRKGKLGGGGSQEEGSRIKAES